MSTHKNRNVPISSPWRLMREITLGNLFQLILLLGMIAAGWMNLRTTLAIIQHDLDRLLQMQSKLEARVDSLQTDMLNHACRLGQLEKPP